jgi:hypothetical protein
MNNKNRYIFSIFLAFSLASLSAAITKDELAGIISDMESSISDIYIEYEWLTIPEWTMEDFNKEDYNNFPVLLPKDGKSSFKLYLARIEPDSNQIPKEGVISAPNDPNNISPLNWNFRLEENATLFAKNGSTFQQINIKSYDGLIGRTLSIGGLPRTVKTGEIYFDKPGIALSISPVGFSVFRMGLSAVTRYYPLSVIFKKYPDLIVLDETIRKINGFNTIRAVFLQQTTNKPIMRIYFSKDHNYYPVRYEYLKGPDNVDFMFRVETLEKIGEKLWFPSSGITSASDEERVGAFQTTAPILCNQHKKNDFFEIEFPTGTEVQDQINNKKYIVK